MGVWGSVWRGLFGDLCSTLLTSACMWYLSSMVDDYSSESWRSQSFFCSDPPLRTCTRITECGIKDCWLFGEGAQEEKWWSETYGYDFSLEYMSSLYSHLDGAGMHHRENKRTVMNALGSLLKQHECLRDVFPSLDTVCQHLWQAAKTCGIVDGFNITLESKALHCLQFMNPMWRTEYWFKCLDQGVVSWSEGLKSRSGDVVKHVCMDA